ncbi:MAG: hypothetical protein O3B87_02170 [bacterium]|nr:hypothetical protein [bacterium]
MSRLYRHKQHQQNKKIGIFLVLMVVSLFILFKLGFRSLIDSAVLLSSFGDKKEVLAESDKDFVGFLQLDEPMTATNSAELLVEGSVKDYDSLVFYINDTPVDETNIQGSSFSEKITGLEVGENRVYVEARSKDTKHTVSSDVYVVMYTNEIPKITIDSPNDGDTIRLADLKISGSTKPGANLRINNQPVVVGFDGSINTTYRLKEGDNTLMFTATDIAGNSATYELKVKYEKDD